MIAQELARCTEMFDGYRKNLRDNTKLLKKSKSEKASLIRWVKELQMALAEEKLRANKLEDDVQCITTVMQEERHEGVSEGLTGC